MGAWDIGPFDNDDACDWLYDLERSEDVSLLSNTLEGVTEIGEEYLEAPECCTAIAAAEILAAMRGKPAGTLPENAREWIKKNQAREVGELLPLALSALARIRSNSELKELWEESDEAERWVQTVDDLTARLKG